MQKTMKKASLIALGSAGVMMSLLPTLPALAATNGDAMIPSVTLSESGNTFTAQGVDRGSTPLEYQFVVTAPNGHSWIAQRFMARNTFTYTPPGAGYKVQANAMTAYQVQHQEWNIHTASNTLTANVASVSKPTLTENNGVWTAHATASNGAQVYYQFLVQKPNGQQYIAQRFTASNTFTFNQPGYKVEANALTAAQVAAKDWSAAVGSGFQSLSVTISTPTLTVANGTWTASATASDGSPVDYQFLVKNPDGSWYIAQRFSSSATFHFTPPAAGYSVKANALTASQVAAKDWNAAVGSDWVAAVLPSGITLAPLTSLTANGTSTEVGTLTMLNNNNTVAANQTVTLTSSNPSVVSVPSSVTTNAQGQATYTITAGTKAGTATITATSDGLTATTTITTTAGPAVTVNLSPATSKMAADGAASENLTATVVDANGNPVLNYNGTVGVVLTSTDLAPTDALNGTTANDTAQNPYWFQAKNGVATISLQESSGVNPQNNIGDSVTVTPILPGGMLETTDTATVALTAPQQTYDVLGVYSGPGSLNGGTNFTPIPSTIANNDTSLALGAFVADQNQIPMPLGASSGDQGTVNVHVSGPATLTEYNVAGGGSATGLTSATLALGTGVGLLNYVQLVPNANATGTVTLTLTNPSNGLQVGSPVTIQVVPPQTAMKWAVTSSTPTTFTADQVVNDAYAKSNASEQSNRWTGSSTSSTSPTYTIQAEDSNGLAASAQPPSFAVTTASGKAVDNLKVTNVTPDGTGAYTFQLAYLGGALAAGTYNVTVTEGLMTTLTVPVAITTGKPYQIGVTPSAPTVDVTTTQPSVTVTGQVEDALGNAVAAPGAQLTFTPQTAADLSLTGGSVNASTGAATVYVNSTGAATVQAAALTRGNDGYVTVTGQLANQAVTANGTSSLTSATSASIVETESPVAHLAGTVTGNDYVAGSNQASGKAFPDVLVTEENAANSPITSADTLDYSIQSTNPFFSATQGSVVPSGTSTSIPVAEIVDKVSLPGNNMAGTYTVKVWDASNSAVAPITETVTINSGTAAGVGLFANGAEVQQDVPGAQNAPYDTNYNVPNTASGSIAVTANKPVGVWVHVTDATGNIVAAPAGGVTVDLSTTSPTAAFENAAGDPITSVVIPAGENGVEVYLADSKTESVPVQATYKVVPTASFAGTSNGVATVTTHGTTTLTYDYSWTVNVGEPFGNPITGLTAKSFALVDTSASPNVTYTGTSGTLAVGDFTVTPVSGTPGEYTITAESSSKVPTTDVAAITADGDTINGTF